MKREQHLAVDKIIFGKEYPEVHAWLDASYYRLKLRGEKIPFYHWLETHHIEAIRKQYGDLTIEFAVAYQHILADFLSRFGVVFVPKDAAQTNQVLIGFNALPAQKGD